MTVIRNRYHGLNRFSSPVFLMTILLFGSSLFMNSCSSESPAPIPTDFAPAGSTAPNNSLAREPARLEFELPENVADFKAGDCMILIVKTLDSDGKVTSPVNDTQIMLSSSSGTLFPSDNCEGTGSVMSWKAGRHALTVSFKANEPGPAEIAADESPARGWAVARKQVTIQHGVSSIKIDPGTQTLLTNTCHPLKLTLTNSRGLPSTLDEDFSLNVDFSTPDFFVLPDTETFSDRNCSTQEESFNIPEGSTELTLYFSTLSPGPMKFVTSGEFNGKKLGGVLDSRFTSSIEGNWATGCIQTDDNIHQVLELNVKDQLFTYIQKVFDSCQANRILRYEVQMNGQVNLGQIASRSEGATQAVDFVYSDSCIKPVTAQTASVMNMAPSKCGISQFAEGVCTTTTANTSCAASESVDVGDVVRERIISTAAVTTGTPSPAMLTFASSNLYPGGSLNNPNVRSIVVKGVRFTKLP